MVIRISKTSLLSFSLLLVLLTSSDVLAASGLDHAEGVSDDSILYYKPSQIGSLVFAMLYFSTSLLLFINVYSWRDWWAHCLPIGSLVSTAGYIIRGFVLRGNPGSLPAYISQDLFIVLAPAAFLAFNYASFGRIATAIAGFYGTEKKNVNLTLINPKRMGVYFVCSDVATFLIQASGGAMQTSQNLKDTGAKIFLFGIIAQFVSYVIFLFLVIRCHHLCKSIHATSQTSLGTGITIPSINKTFLVLYFSSFWIIVRSAYRTIELTQGFRGYLITREIYLFLLDSLPLVLAIAIYIPFYPSSTYPISKKFPADSRGTFMPLWDVGSRLRPENKGFNMQSNLSMTSFLKVEEDSRRPSTNSREVHQYSPRHSSTFADPRYPPYYETRYNYP